MPWKLILFLLMLIMITLFTGFNLENTCDISFVFYTFKAVPVFVSMLFSFVAGALVVFPFMLVSTKKSKKKDSHTRDASQYTGSSQHTGFSHQKTSRPAKGDSRQSKRAPYDPYNSDNE